MKNKIFLGCFFISLTSHAIFLAALSLPEHNKANPKKLAKKMIEVSYAATPGSTKKPQQISVPKKQETPSSAKNPLFKTHKIIQEFIKNEDVKAEAVPKPYAPKNELSVKRSISLPAIPGETAKTPEYRSYYQIIREKIRKLAYYHYKKLQQGEVYLSFLLSSDGQLINVIVNEKNSSPDEYLQSIAMQSVRESAPYPEFPDKLKTHSQLTFHVIISFELT